MRQGRIRMATYEVKAASAVVRSEFIHYDKLPGNSSTNSRIPGLNVELTRPMVLDIVERTIIAILFSTFAYRMLKVPDVKPSIAIFLLVASEVLPAIFILFRRHSAAHSDKVIDWCLGFVGTNVALLSLPAAPGTIISQELCSAILLLGFYVQVASKVILRRSFGVVAANRGVKIEGPYRFVRHPIYAGYTIAHIGFLLGFPSLHNLILYSVALAIQIARMLREERLLNNDPSYCEYAARVRYRLIPMVF
jgi:protein-S-isoprenylcysteine O-methyltransferase Ste14